MDLEISEEVSPCHRKHASGTGVVRTREKVEWTTVQRVRQLLCAGQRRRESGRSNSHEFGVSHFVYLRDMKWGDHIAERVKAAIAQCTHLLLIATATSQESGWVAYELGQAVALGKGVLTFVPHAMLQLNDVLKRHLYVTQYDAIREFFSRPNISREAVDESLRNPRPAACSAHAVCPGPTRRSRDVSNTVAGINRSSR